MTKRKAKNSKKVVTYANRAQKISRDTFLQDLCKGMYEAYKNNDNRLPYGHLNNLLKEVKPDNDWMTRNRLNKAFIKYKTQQLASKPTNEDVPTVVGMKKDDSLLLELSNVRSAVKSIGRSVGSTEEKKKKDETTLIQAKNEIAKKYAILKSSAARKGNQ